jgi:hypothetical protein
MGAGKDSLKMIRTKTSGFAQEATCIFSRLSPEQAQHTVWPGNYNSFFFWQILINFVTENLQSNISKCELCK